MQTILRTKWAALLFLIISYLLIYNPYTKIPYTFIVIIVFILLATFLQDGNLKNLHLKKIGLREVKIIAISYLVLELVMDFIVQPLVSYVLNEPADYSAFSSIEGNTALYTKWLLRMWISAAVGEELLFRAFVFAQAKKIIGDKPVLIIFISALLFSLPHWYQGTAGLVVTFIFGLAFAWIYHRFKNIWINIIVHGLIDTVFLTLSYYGALEFYNLFS